MYELGIIGLGNMGGAILRGAIKAEAIDPSKVIIFEKNRDKVLDLLEENVRLAESEIEVAKYSEKLLLAIKPQGFKYLGEKIREDLNKEALIISIAAGINLGQLKEIFSEDNKYIWAMPNMPVQINQGMTALVVDENVGHEELFSVIKLFESVGKVAIINEDKMNTFSTAVGSMPATVSIFVEALADGAVKCGMGRREAYDYIIQAIIGSAQYLQNTREHPGLLKDKVASPKGTTIELINKLEENRFRYALMDAIEAGVRAAERISEEKK